MAVMDEISSVGFEAIVELHGLVDIEAMELAWARLAARHPILTCVRREGWWRPGTLPEFGEDVAAAPGDDGPPIALRLRQVDGGWRLTLMCHHVAFDGMASLILLGDLRDEYTGVLEGRPEHPPDLGPRTLETLAEPPDWRSTAAMVARGAAMWWRTPVSTHVDPGPVPEVPAEDHATIEVGPLLAELAPLRRRHRWSVDAVLVGVLEKAWSEVFGPPAAESSWVVARDLRPPLGATRGIGNLSAAAGVSLISPRARLAEVIDQAEGALASQSADLVTAGSSLGLLGPATDMSVAQMLRRSRRLRAYRTVSNVGQIGESLAEWGGAGLARVWFVGPLAHPPYTSFIATGHGDSTLVSMRVSPGWLTGAHAAAMEQAANGLL
jgi:NRPS condensation-like uncharacterized protein